MAEYIERERIRKALVGACLMNQNCPMFIAAKIDQMIDCEPAADVAPVVHGKWFKPKYEYHVGICSLCGCVPLKPVWGSTSYNYCPNCGAKMDEEEHNNV